MVCYLELAKVCNIIIQPNGLAGSFQQGTRSAGSHQLARCGHNGKVYKHDCRKVKCTESARSGACADQEVFTEYEVVMSCTGSAEQVKRQVEMHWGKINEKNLPSPSPIGAWGIQNSLLLVGFRKTRATKRADLN